jgi:hypothetical protein
MGALAGWVPRHWHLLGERFLVAASLDLLRAVGGGLWHLALLQQLARWVDLHVYALNPCAEYWFDVVDPRRLATDIEPLEHQRRQTDGEHHRLDILDPMAREIADRPGMGDHTPVDEGEEAECQGSAPEQGRADEDRGEGLEIRHPSHLPNMLSVARRNDRARVRATGTIHSIGRVHLTD